MPNGIAPAAEKKAGRILSRISAWFAVAGGAVLAGMAVLTVGSIIGRSLSAYGFSTITGDFELVEMGCAIAVFSFMPWCQLNRGHITVDIFINRAPSGFRRLMVVIGDMTIALIAFVIAWRLGLGLQDKYAYSETTFILRLPVWYGYAAGTAGAALFAVVSIYTVWRSLNGLLMKEDAR